MSIDHRCRTCARLMCELTTATGEPLDWCGVCAEHQKRVAIDDFCNRYEMAHCAREQERADMLADRGDARRKGECL